MQMGLHLGHRRVAGKRVSTAVEAALTRLREVPLGYRFSTMMDSEFSWEMKSS